MRSEYRSEGLEEQWSERERERARDLIVMEVLLEKCYTGDFEDGR